MEKENETKEMNELVNEQSPHTHIHTHMENLHESMRLVCYGMRINATGVTEENETKPKFF